MLIYNQILTEMPDLRLDSSSDSFESSSEGTSPAIRLNEYGMPLSKPVFVSIGQSSVLNRAREFLPLFREATLHIMDPKIEKPNDSEILIPRERSCSSFSDNSSDSQSSYGVEVDIGMGVFDVNGSVDEETLIKNGTPMILTHTVSESGPDHMESPLIQEIGSKV
jgi:hypothetical protein